LSPFRNAIRLEWISHGSARCEWIWILYVLDGEVKVEILTSEGHQLCLEGLDLTLKQLVFLIFVLSYLFELGHSCLEALDMGLFAFPECALGRSILCFAFLTIRTGTRFEEYISRLRHHHFPTGLFLWLRLCFV
jgi:hypothetical protein